jgi:hypothetical protein
MNIFNAETQEEFIYAAYYWHTYPSQSTIQWLYKLGRDRRLLNIDFEEFRRTILNDQNPYCNEQYSFSRKIKYRRSHFCDPSEYRVLKGFKYSGQKKKQDLSNKDAWRLEKKIIKDKQRSSMWRNTWKKDLKHFSVRKHRRMERDFIKTEKYDSFYKTTYKYAEDPWGWW